MTTLLYCRRRVKPAGDQKALNPYPATFSPVNAGKTNARNSLGVSWSDQAGVFDVRL
jgi:hypothetical protein